MTEINRQAQILRDEKLEERELRRLILDSTNTIPMKLRTGGSYQDAVLFKKEAVAARKVAKSFSSSIDRLREAWAKISLYYT